jgi:hypothetical protein
MVAKNPTGNEDKASKLGLYCAVLAGSGAVYDIIGVGEDRYRKNEAGKCVERLPLVVRRPTISIYHLDKQL